MSSHYLRYAVAAASLFAFAVASALPTSAHDGRRHNELAALAGAGATTAASGPAEPSLDEVRQATERFRDVSVALAEGYVRDPGDICETAEMMGKPVALGAMGIHFFRPDLLGIAAPPNPRVDGTGTHTDFRNPAILIYEPQADGSLELVAVENLVFRKVWHAAGNNALPTFQGVAYDTMADDPGTVIDEAHNFEPHYDRHAWIYRENSNGVFAVFNPSVTCMHHRGGSHQHANR
jgi:hypothetical protein